jgi:hypothetical protein
MTDSGPNDPGAVHFSADEVQVRLPRSTPLTPARILGMREVGAGLVAIYLDRLVHYAKHSSVGGYSISGGVTTILTGPKPDVTFMPTAGVRP